MKANLKDIMTKAWTIAYKSVKRFGGKAGQYFSLALKQSWAEAKSVAKLVALGGNEWSSDSGNTRVYFNNETIQSWDFDKKKDIFGYWNDFYFDCVEQKWSFQAQRFFGLTGLII